jgi:DNA-binding MarR family transcriptional regulator
MRLPKYDTEILGILAENNANIYQLHKEIKEKQKVDYSVIKRAVDRLESKKYIILTKKGTRDSKEFSILIRGLAKLYILNRGKRDPLEFHRSEEGKKLVEKIITYLIKKMEKILDDDNKEKLSKFLYSSPSYTEFYHNEYMDNSYIRIRDLQEEYIDKIVKNSFDCPLPIIKNMEIFELKCLLGYYPFYFLAKDLSHYSDDVELASLLVEAYVDQAKSQICYVRNKPYDKLRENLIFYIPMVGTPILALLERIT